MTTKKENKIKVEIACEQVFCFRQEVEITLEEYELLKNLEGDEIHEQRNRKEYSILQEYIDVQNVFDSHNEFLDFEISEVKKKQKTR